MTPGETEAVIDEMEADGDGTPVPRPGAKPGSLEHALQLALAADPPDPAAVESARLALVRTWDGMARQIAYTWYARTRRGDPRDYHAAAVLGFWEAATRFEPDKGNTFPAYAKWYGLKYVKEMVQQEAAGGLRVPHHHGVTTVPVQEFGAIKGSRDSDDGGDIDFAGTVAAKEPDPWEDRDEPAAVWATVGGLLANERERLVLRRRLVEGKTLDEIGEELDLSKERVRQIEAAALSRLREQKERFAGFTD